MSRRSSPFGPSARSASAKPISSTSDEDEPVDARVLGLHAKPVDERREIRERVARGDSCAGRQVFAARRLEQRNARIGGGEREHLDRRLADAAARRSDRAAERFVIRRDSR